MKNSRIVNHYAPIEGPVTVSFFPNLSSLQSNSECQISDAPVKTATPHHELPLPPSVSTQVSSGPAASDVMVPSPRDVPIRAPFSTNFSVAGAIEDLKNQHPNCHLLLQPIATAENPRLIVTSECAAAKLTASEFDAIKATFSQKATLPGLLACAVITEDSGKILARHSQSGHDAALEKAVAASLQLLRANREAARLMGLSQFDEFTTSSSHFQIMLRTSSRYDGIFIMALLDQQRTNLTTARLNLMEIDKQLA
ncbi:MAG: hypothetical protein ACK542_11605 [Burkholderiales bacterium]